MIAHSICSYAIIARDAERIAPLLAGERRVLYQAPSGSGKTYYLHISLARARNNRVSPHRTKSSAGVWMHSRLWCRARRNAAGYLEALSSTCR
jgi:superfamily II DNA/RNA helicase